MYVGLPDTRVLATGLITFDSIHCSLLFCSQMCAQSPDCNAFNFYPHHPCVCVLKPTGVVETFVRKKDWVYYEVDNKYITL